MAQSVIRKVNQIYDEIADAWDDVYEVVDVAGNTITIAVPREEQLAPRNVLRILMRKGGVLSNSKDDEEALAMAMAASAPILIRAASTGWRPKDGHDQFVSHHFAFGPPGAPQILPPIADPTLIANSGAKGSLDVWRAIISLARHSTAMLLALCAAFAAPLLKLLRRPNFAIVLVGPSRCGKSTAQFVAASVLAVGREEELPTLQATPAGLLAAALIYNDHVLIFNEVGAASGKKMEVYGVLRGSTYALIGGKDVLRHPSWKGGANNGSFQSIFLLSSEHSPDVWAARNGETRDDGEMARLIGVPVEVTEFGRIFDQPPEDLDGPDLESWTKAQFSRLRTGLAENNGFAFEAYVRHLLSNLNGCTKEAEKRIAQFEKHMANLDLTPVARDIVAKFGVLFAGGCLAVEAGILPFDVKTLAQAVKRSCVAALAALPDQKAELRADLKLLQEKLSGSAILDCSTITGQKLRVLPNADGYLVVSGASRKYVVRAKEFGDWFPNLLRVRHVLEWLDDEGFLSHGRARKPGRSLEWAQSQELWPDKTRPRSVVIDLPAGLGSLDRFG